MTLQLDNVTRRFGGLVALNNVNMRVEPNTIVGLIGPNGAGKTTLINNISGLDHPTSGTISFAGTPIHEAPPHHITRLGITRTYQNIRLFTESTAKENILIGQHGQGNASWLASMVFLPAFRREEATLSNTADALLKRFSLDDIAHIQAGNLPYGDQRRLELARAIAANPKLILLDEPTAGMNPAETHALGEQILLLREAGIAVLVIEHDMSLIRQVCDVVYVLNFGRIIAHGTPDEIRQNEVVIEAYLGSEDDL